MAMRYLIYFTLFTAITAFRAIAPTAGSWIASNDARKSTKLMDVPLELEGQLDPSKSWPVKFVFNGVEKVITVSEGTSFLEAGEGNFDDVPSSCRNGVCTTCSGQVR